MRRLGKGHTLTILIIPEIAELIQREMALARSSGLSMLQAVAAWLTVQAMRTDVRQSPA
jgi:hypothetical protein